MMAYTPTVFSWLIQNGIGIKLLKKELLQKYQMQSLGYKNAVLQASQDGIELYKKMGFQTFRQYFEFA
jgi:hypothetical protein